MVARACTDLKEVAGEIGVWSGAAHSADLPPPSLLAPPFLAGPSGLGVGLNAMRALAMISGAQPGSTLADDVAAAGVPGVREVCMLNSSGAWCGKGRDHAWRMQ